MSEISKVNDRSMKVIAYQGNYSMETCKNRKKKEIL